MNPHEALMHALGTVKNQGLYIEKLKQENMRLKETVVSLALKIEKYEIGELNKMWEVENGH